VCGQKKLWAIHSLFASLWTTQEQLQGHDCSAKWCDKDCDTKKTWWDGNAESDGAKESQVRIFLLPQLLSFDFSVCRFTSAMLPRNHLFSTEPGVPQPLQFNELLQKAIEARAQEGQTFLICLSFFMKSFQT
jgi:hypothetical protein